jgi:peptidyl-prolyl cis-trans isomerase-like protein 2
MFEAIANPVKGKGKEKDVGKRRAYVRVVTSLGGSLNLELFCEKVYAGDFVSVLAVAHPTLKAPKTCYNFLMLSRSGKYNNCVFHRLSKRCLLVSPSIFLFAI